MLLWRCGIIPVGLTSCSNRHAVECPLLRLQVLPAEDLNKLNQQLDAAPAFPPLTLPSRGFSLHDSEYKASASEVANLTRCLPACLVAIFDADTSTKLYAVPAFMDVVTGACYVAMGSLLTRC